MDAYLGCLSQWENDKGRRTFRIPTAAFTKVLNGECAVDTTLRNVSYQPFNIAIS